MLKFAIPAVAALGLIAVAAQSRATDSDVAQISGGPMGWRLSHEPGLAKLAYGVENSDQLALMMTCRRGKAQAVVYGDVHPARARMVRTSLTTAEIDPLNGDLVQEMLISTGDPTMRRLARDGALAVQGEAGDFELTATQKERRLISDFFAYCGSDKT
jgi:hypothetical protein